MSTPNTGGMAFPAVTVQQRGDPAYNRATYVYHPGMTLRDYFAGQALQAMVAGQGARMVADRDERYDGNSNWREVVAANAYEFADAMLAERAKVK